LAQLTNLRILNISYNELGNLIPLPPKRNGSGSGLTTPSSPPLEHSTSPSSSPAIHRPGGSDSSTSSPSTSTTSSPKSSRRGHPTSSSSTPSHPPTVTISSPAEKLSTSFSSNPPTSSSSALSPPHFPPVGSRDNHGGSGGDLVSLVDEEQHQKKVLEDLNEVLSKLVALEQFNSVGNPIEIRLPDPIAHLVKYVKSGAAEPSEITERLFLGGVESAYHKQYLRKHQVTHILTVMPDCPPIFPELFTYKIISVDDNPRDDLFSKFEECCRFIGKWMTKGCFSFSYCSSLLPLPLLVPLLVLLASSCFSCSLVLTTFLSLAEGLTTGGGVLIHCAAGVSRSATVATAWLMRAENIGVKEALEKVKAKRFMINPNSGFREQLVRWETHIKEHPHQHHHRGSNGSCIVA
jgi:hypothetical protein